MSLNNHPRCVLPFGLYLRLVLSSLVLTLALHPNSLRACAACYGQSDSPMAAGMNWGIMSLLVVIAVVLGGVASFFVYLAKRAASVAAGPAAGSLPASTDEAWPRRGGAPVVGGSDVRKRWDLGTLRPARHIGACCARGRARSEASAFDGDTRKLHPGSADSVL